jgi:hypothetical protein
MKIPNGAGSDDMTLYDILRASIALVTQLRGKYTFIDTSPTQQVVMPFDLGDVARAFNSSFASRFAHLEDQSND